MEKVVLFISFKLKKDSNIEEFLIASKKLNDEYMSKQKGYISWQQLNEGDNWVDMLTFETMEDAKAIEANPNPCELALKFYSYINLPSCITRYYQVKANYN